MFYALMWYSGTQSRTWEDSLLKAVFNDDVERVLQVCKYAIDLNTCVDRPVGGGELKYGRERLGLDGSKYRGYPLECVEGDTILHIAIRNGSFKCVPLFLRMGVNVHTINSHGAIALHELCGGRFSPNASILVPLLAKKSNIFLEDQQGNTPMNLIEMRLAYTQGTNFFLRVLEIQSHMYHHQVMLELREQPWNPFIDESFPTTFHDSIQALIDALPSHNCILQDIIFDILSFTNRSFFNSTNTANV